MASALAQRFFDGYLTALGLAVQWYAHLLGKVARTATLKSKTVLAVWFGLCLLCLVGVLRFNNVTDSNKLWVDVNGEGAQHAALVKSFLNESDAFFTGMIFKSSPTDDVMTFSGVSQMFAIQAEVLNLRTPSRNKSLHDLCVRRNDEPDRCFTSGLFQFWNDNATLFATTMFTDADVKTWTAQTHYPDGSQVDRLLDYGNFELVPVVKATAFTWNVFFQKLDPDVDGIRQADIAEFLAVLGKDVVDAPPALTAALWPSFTIFYTYETAIDEALSSTVSRDISLMIIAFVLMIAFTQFMLGRPFSQFEGRLVLAIEAVVVIVFSMLAAFGLSMAFGVPFTTLQSILPFLVLGIGIDNAFVVVSAVDAQSRALPLEDRMSNAMIRVGINITVTSLVDVVALLFALASRLPAVQFFGVYAALSILFIYLSYVTAFVAFVAIDERRRENGRMDPLFCLSTRPPQTTEYADTAKNDTAMDKVRVVLVEYYGRFLLKRWVKAIVIVLYFALTAFMGYEASLLGYDFNVVDLCPSDSAAFKYVTTHQALFYGLEFPGNSIPLYLTDINYTDAQVQAQIRDLVNATRHLKCINGDVLPVNFLDYMTTYGMSVPALSSLPMDPQNLGFIGDGFYTVLNAFLAVPQYKYYFRDNVVQRDGVIVLSSIEFTLAFLETAELQVACLEETKRAVAESALGASKKAFFHGGNEQFWEQKGFMSEEAAHLFTMTLVSVAVVCAIFLVHPVAIFIQLVCMGTVFVQLLGALSLLGIDLNSISVVNMIMAIGLIVDATVHIVRTFGVQDPKLSRNDRVLATLGELGTPIFLGAITIILGVIPLSGASSEVFRVFFLCFLAIVVFGWVCGLVFVPVVLSLIGPVTFRNLEDFTTTVEPELKQQQQQQQYAAAQKLAVDGQ